MPMVKFIPSDEQREVVAALSAAKMPLEKIASSIINPRTKRAISVKTLGRMFKGQLDAGVGVVVEAYRGLRVALAAKEPWAIKYTLDHIAEFKAKEKEITVPEAVKKAGPDLQIAFMPSPFVDEPIAPELEPPPRMLTLVPSPPPDNGFEPPRGRHEPGPPHVGEYRTEMDDPAVQESLLPFHRRKLTGRLRPLQGGKKRDNGWLG